MSLRRLFDSTVVRFGLVGVLATLVHTAVAYSLTFATGLDQLAINTIAFLTAFSVSGLGHVAYTFRLQTGRGAAIVRWFAVSVSGLLVGNAVILVGLHLVHLPREVCQGGAILATAVWSFAASRLWAFRARQES